MVLGPLLGSCHVYDESLVSGGPGTNDGLRHAPPRPTTPDGPDVEPLTAALRDPLIVQGNLWREIGLDLDGFNTTADNKEQECLSPKFQSTELDGTDGIDNVFGASFALLVTGAIPDLASKATEAQAAGNGTLIIRMSGWNGTPNDPLVSVVISQAVDGTSADPSLVEFRDFELVMKDTGEPAPPPAWDGHDHWWVRDDTFIGGNESMPSIADDAAYVADNKVVLRLPDRVNIYFFVGDQVVKVNLTGAMSIGTMNEDHTQLTDTIVAGRWARNDLLLTADYIGVCEGDNLKDVLLSGINGNADVRSQIGSGGPGVECDAISLGMRFGLGVIGSWEGVVPAPPVLNPCADRGDGGV